MANKHGKFPISCYGVRIQRFRFKMASGCRSRYRFVLGLAMCSGGCFWGDRLHCRPLLFAKPCGIFFSANLKIAIAVSEVRKYHAIQKYDPRADRYISYEISWADARLAPRRLRGSHPIGRRRSREYLYLARRHSIQLSEDARFISGPHPIFAKFYTRPNFALSRLCVRWFWVRFVRLCRTVVGSAMYNIHITPSMYRF